MPASSIARAEASISSSGSMVSCITPTRNGTAMAAPPSPCLPWRRRRLPSTPCPSVPAATALCTSRSSAFKHVLDLLVDDRLEHALPHRADRAGELDVRRPVHRRAALGGVAELERRDHAQHRADALALDVQLRELGLALVGLLHVDLHLQAAEPERDLDVGGPAQRVVHVEALDAGHRLRHRGWIVQHAPHRRARCSEDAVAGDVHASTTDTRPPADAGLVSSSHTRWYGFALSHTTALP